jgi:hypothetical protein
MACGHPTGGGCAPAPPLPAGLSALHLYSPQGALPPASLGSIFKEKKHSSPVTRNKGDNNVRSEDQERLVQAFGL